MLLESIWAGRRSYFGLVAPASFLITGGRPLADDPLTTGSLESLESQV